MFDAIISDVISGKLTLQAALEAASTKSDAHILSALIGRNVFIRTVTHHYTGKLEQLKDGFLALSSAAWIADDGRFNECVGKGKLNEVEPYPDALTVYVSIGSIVDCCEWLHKLPREVK